MIATLARYRKAITAEVGALITWLSVAYVPDGHITRVEWYGLVVALAAGAGVFAVPNEPKPDPGPASQSQLTPAE